jgi:phytanoyl-CoA hydroxylase
MNQQQLDKHKNRLSHEFGLDGYVSIPGFFDADEVGQLRENKDRFIRDVVPTMPETEVYYDDKNDPTTLKQLQMMWKHDDFFGGLMAADSKLSALAETCIGETPRPVNMQYFNKSPKASQPTPPHQDGYFFHLIPNNAITMWIALEDVEPEQGCVNYVQGSHKYGMRAHGPSGTLGFSQTILDFGLPYDREHTKSFPCKAGHLIAHHSLTIHWADGNTSGDKSRQAIGAIYYGASCTENEKTKQAYQARLDAALAARGKI